MTALKNLRFSSKNTVPKKEVGEKKIKRYISSKSQNVHPLPPNKC